MGRSGIERRELLTALTAGLLSACGIKPEQAPVQRLPEIPPLAQPKPTEVPVPSHIERIVQEPRLAEWRNYMANADVFIFNYGDAPIEGTVEPEEGLRTRLYPDVYFPVGPLWTWLLKGEKVRFQATVIVRTRYGSAESKQSFAVLTTPQKDHPDRTTEPAYFPLFTAINVTGFGSRDGEFISYQEKPFQSIFRWERSGKLVPVRPDDI